MSLLTPIGDGAARLAVRVTPRGGRDAVDGVVEDAEGRPLLKIRVSAAPSDGAANKAVTALLAKTFGVPKSAVAITAGQSSRVKQIELTGDPEELRRRIEAALGGR